MRRKRGTAFTPFVLLCASALFVSFTPTAGASSRVDLDELGADLENQVSQFQQETVDGQTRDTLSVHDSLVPVSLRHQLRNEADGIKETGTLKITDTDATLEGDPQILSTYVNGSPHEVLYTLILQQTIMPLQHFPQDTDDDSTNSKAMVPITIVLDTDGKVSTSTYETLMDHHEGSISLEDFLQGPADYSAPFSIDTSVSPLSTRSIPEQNRVNRVVSYALEWWNRRNPRYISFDTDCANFVSQSLHAGGGGECWMAARKFPAHGGRTKRMPVGVGLLRKTSIEIYLKENAVMSWRM